LPRVFTGFRAGGIWRIVRIISFSQLQEVAEGAYWRQRRG
jgi:hypothetical protein